MIGNSPKCENMRNGIANDTGWMLQCSSCWLKAKDTRGCSRRGEVSEEAPEAVRQAVGGGCQGGWGWLLSVTNATEPGTCRQGYSGWA